MALAIAMIAAYLPFLVWVYSEAKKDLKEWKEDLKGEPNRNYEEGSKTKPDGWHLL